MVALELGYAKVVPEEAEAFKSVWAPGKALVGLLYELDSPDK